ncbi:hypothetical protein HDZ31DRAFT_33103, partial [Schizophyllum fasciatum]
MQPIPILGVAASADQAGPTGAGPSGSAHQSEESFLQSVANIWDEEMLGTIDPASGLAMAPPTSAEDGALMLPTPNSVSSASIAAESAVVLTRTCQDSPEPTPRPTRHSPPASALISMSTTFTASAKLGGAAPDIALVSTDGVYFYVNCALLAGVSANGFDGLLPPKDRSPDGYPLGRARDAADVLNVVLHAIYDMSPARYAPSVTTLLSALGRLPAYGLAPAQYAAPPRVLYLILLAQAPLAPLAVYTAAARCGLHDLAVAVSPHLLSFPLPALTDAQAEAMGAVYLKRLFMLHKQRVEALKGVLAQAPYPHPETETCNFADQKKVARAWQLAATYLVAEAQPDLPPSRMEATVNSLMVGMTCESCKEALRTRLQKAVVEWTMLPVPFAFDSKWRASLCPLFDPDAFHRLSAASRLFMLHDMQDVLQRFPTPPPTKEKEKLILRSAEPYRRQPLILVDCTDSWERTKSGGAVGPRHAALNLSAEVLTQRSESSPARRHRRYTEAERALEQSLHALASSGSPDRALHATASLLRALSESSGEAARQIRALIASSDLHGSALQAAKRERWVWEMRQRQASEQLAKLPQAPAAPSADRRQRNLARFLESSEHKLAIRPTARLKR